MSGNTAAGGRSPGWARNPGYVIDFVPLAVPVRAELAGRIVAQSADARVMLEQGHAPVCYFSRDCLDASLLEPSRHTTFCPYKGHASYWSVRVGNRVSENALWSYLDPYEEVAMISGFMGLYWERMDAWYEGGRRVSEPSALLRGGERG